MANTHFKTFDVSAEDNKKIIKQFPREENDFALVFRTTDDIKADKVQNDEEMMAYSVYFARRIHSSFGFKVSVANGYL